MGNEEKPLYSVTFRGFTVREWAEVPGVYRAAKLDNKLKVGREVEA